MRIKKRYLLGGLLAYYGLPYLLMQIANLGVVREGKGYKPQMALTFDDGPDPETTPLVLEALKEANVKATFFMVGEKVRLHPEWVREVVRQGHEVASHGDKHRSSWLRFPWEIGPDHQKAIDALHEATGEYPRFFRPPHGMYTLANWWTLQQSPVKAAHWSIEAHDWRSDHTPEKVRERILKHAEPGGVIVMHDAGPGALNTVPALPELLKALKTRGYQLVALKDLEGLKSADGRNILRRLWAYVDRVYDRQREVDYFTQHSRGVMRLSRSKYFGPDITTVGGDHITHGDEEAELHLHSARLVNVAEHNPVAAYRMLSFSLKELAKAFEENPKYQSCRVIFGASLFSEVVEPLGFHVTDIPDPAEARKLKSWMNFIRTVYSDTPNRRALDPKFVWMDRETLLERYGSKKSARNN